jgi:hypothetical protein
MLRCAVWFRQACLPNPLSAEWILDNAQDKVMVLLAQQ